MQGRQAGEWKHLDLHDARSIVSPFLLRLLLYNSTILQFYNSTIIISLENYLFVSVFVSKMGNEIVKTVLHRWVIVLVSMEETK